MKLDLGKKIRIWNGPGDILLRSLEESIWIHPCKIIWEILVSSLVHCLRDTLRFNLRLKE